MTILFAQIGAISENINPKTLKIFVKVQYRLNNIYEIETREEFIMNMGICLCQN